MMPLNELTERLVLPQAVIWPKSLEITSPGFSCDQFVLHLDSTSEEVRSGTVGSTILIDFSQELYGGVRFEVANVAPQELGQPPG